LVGVDGFSHQVVLVLEQASSGPQRGEAGTRKQNKIGQNEAKKKNQGFVQEVSVPCQSTSELFQDTNTHETHLVLLWVHIPFLELEIRLIQRYNFLLR